MRPLPSWIREDEEFEVIPNHSSAVLTMALRQESTKVLLKQQLLKSESLERKDSMGRRSLRSEGRRRGQSSRSSSSQRRQASFTKEYLSASNVHCFVPPVQTIEFVNIEQDARYRSLRSVGKSSKSLPTQNRQNRKFSFVERMDKPPRILERRLGSRANSLSSRSAIDEMSEVKDEEGQEAMWIETDIEAKSDSTFYIDDPDTMVVSTFSVSQRKNSLSEGTAQDLNVHVRAITLLPANTNTITI